MVPHKGFSCMIGTSELSFYSFPILTMCPHFTVTFQVGLPLLTNHMCHAVAACTLPEVFFGHTIIQAPCNMYQRCPEDLSDSLPTPVATLETMNLSSRCMLFHEPAIEYVDNTPFPF